MANWTWFHRLGSPPSLLATINRWLPWLLLLTLATLLIGAVWGVLFTPPDFRQGNSYRIIYFHVPSAMVSLAAYYAMAVAAGIHLVWRIKVAEMAMRAIAVVGAMLTFLALASGAIWGKPTWGTWWVWDARLTSMLVLLFLYLGVLALVDAYKSRAQGSRAAAIIALVGTVNIPIIYKSVDWWFSLHQGASIRFTGETSIDTSMLQPLLCMIAAYYLLFLVAVLLQLRVQIVERECGSRWLRRYAVENDPSCGKGRE